MLRLSNIKSFGNRIYENLILRLEFGIFNDLICLNILYLIITFTHLKFSVLRLSKFLFFWKTRALKCVVWYRLRYSNDLIR